MCRGTSATTYVHSDACLPRNISSSVTIDCSFPTPWLPESHITAWCGNVQHTTAAQYTAIVDASCPTTTLSGACRQGIFRLCKALRYLGCAMQCICGHHMHKDAHLPDNCNEECRISWYIRPQMATFLVLPVRCHHLRCEQCTA